MYVTWLDFDLLLTFSGWLYAFQSVILFSEKYGLIWEKSMFIYFFQISLFNSHFYDWNFSDIMFNIYQNLSLSPDGPGLSVVELEPTLDQVVFAGDSLRLRCRVTSAEDNHRVWWARGDAHFQARRLGSSANYTDYLEPHHQHQQRGGAKFKTTYLPDAVERFVCFLPMKGLNI